MFVIQILYDKDDEDLYLPKKYVFADRGEEYQERFETMTHEELQAKTQEWESRTDLVVFSHK